MKLTIHIEHQGISSTFVASVGNGEGTIKWLSLMAAQTYAQQIPHVRMRQRESLLKPHLLPKNVHTNEIPFLHPDWTINKRLRDNQSVKVELYTSLPLDEYGIPKYSPFATIAFFVSESKAHLREILTNEKMQEAQEFDAQRSKEAEERRLAMNRPKLQKMRSILMEQLFNEDSMSNEWTLIMNSGILDSLVPSANEREAIKDFLTNKYEELSQIFKYYSAVNSGGGTHTLEYIEFTKFLQETNIIQSLQSNVIIKLFGASPTNIHSEIIQWEFFVSYIKIALYKYITLAKKKMAALKKRGQNVAIAQASTPTPSKALEMLYNEYLLTIIDRLPASAAVKRALDSEYVLLLMYEHLNELSRVFCKYAETEFNPNDIDGSRDSASMNLQQFILLTTDYGFLGPTPTFTNNDREPVITHNDVTLKDIRQIFSASQHDTAMNDAENNMLEDDGHKETMVFPEYIEAIVRLGFAKFSTPGETQYSDHCQCVQFAITKIISFRQ